MEKQKQNENEEIPSQISESQIIDLSSKLIQSQFIAISNPLINLKAFYCSHINNLVSTIKKYFKVKDYKSKHDFLARVFALYNFGDITDIRFNYNTKRKQIDIVSKDETYIEFKTVVTATEDRIRAVYGAVYNEGVDDRLWLVFFLTFHPAKIEEMKCKYLLVWIDLDLQEEYDIVKERLSEMVQELKDKASKKLGIERTLIIPLGNVFAEDLYKEEAEKHKKEAEKHKKEAEKYKKEAEELRTELREKEVIIQEKDKKLQEKDKKLQEKDKELQEIYAELSKLRKEFEEFKKKYNEKFKKLEKQNQS